MLRSIRWAACVAMLVCGLSPASAITTTYTYTGLDYTYGVNHDPGVNFPLTVEEFQAALPGIYGPHLNAQITFEGDTTATTGTFSLFNSFFPGSITPPPPVPFVREFHINSGLVDFSRTLGGSPIIANISLTDGNVSAWNFWFNASCAASNVPCQGGQLQSSSTGNLVVPGIGDHISFLSGYLGWYSGASTDAPGTWALLPAPVPSPVVGAGLPGLITIVCGILIAWRRRYAAASSHIGVLSLPAGSRSRLSRNG